MSFLDDLLSAGKTAFDWFTGDSTSANLARTGLTAYALNRVTASINKDNDASGNNRIDPGVRLQVDPDTEYKVPVVYGTAILGGAVTDAFMTEDGKTMYFVITICEVTGNTNLGQGAASSFSCPQIWWNSFKVNFSDSVTVASFEDTEGNLNTKVAGKVKIYFYPNGSNSGALPASSVMPGWTGSHTMDQLVFAIVRVDYDREAGLTQLGKIDFKIVNTMTEPGDCLYDYMTNTRYGAGIAPGDIKTL